MLATLKHLPPFRTTLLNSIHMPACRHAMPTCMSKMYLKITMLKNELLLCPSSAHLHSSPYLLAALSFQLLRPQTRRHLVISSILSHSLHQINQKIILALSSKFCILIFFLINNTTTSITLLVLI